MFESLRTHLPLIRVLGASLLGVRKLRADVPADYSDFLRPHFEARPDALALIGDRSRMTWAELDAFAARVAGWAIGQGMKRGDVVALSMENRPEYVGLWLGLSRIGVVTALLNTHLTGERRAPGSSGRSCWGPRSRRCPISPTRRPSSRRISRAERPAPQRLPPGLPLPGSNRSTNISPPPRRPRSIRRPRPRAAAAICSSSSIRAGRPACRRPRASAISRRR